jgi:hypothetical protein
MNMERKRIKRGMGEEEKRDKEEEARMEEED